MKTTSWKRTAAPGVPSTIRALALSDRTAPGLQNGLIGVPAPDSVTARLQPSLPVRYSDQRIHVILDTLRSGLVQLWLFRYPNNHRTIGTSDSCSACPSPQPAPRHRTIENATGSSPASRCGRAPPVARRRCSPWTPSSPATSRRPWRTPRNGRRPQPQPSQPAPPALRESCVPAPDPAWRSSQPAVDRSAPTAASDAPSPVRDGPRGRPYCSPATRRSSDTVRISFSAHSGNPCQRFSSTRFLATGAARHFLLPLPTSIGRAANQKTLFVMGRTPETVHYHKIR